MKKLSLELRHTALVVIDLQEMIAGRDGLIPLSGYDVTQRNNQLAAALKNTPALISLVRVNNTGKEGFSPETDAQSEQRVQATSMQMAKYTMAIAEDLTATNVIKTNKHNWGAFYGTDLDVQLRRRGIDTIILTGIATSMGVDTTAREAAQRGYRIIFVPDAMTDMSQVAHETAVNHIFPRLGYIRQLDEILALILASK